LGSQQPIFSSVQLEPLQGPHLHAEAILDIEFEG